VSEELRLFLRNGLYILSAVVVYWFASYEWAGTVMMAILGIAAITFVTIMGRIVRSSTDEITDRSLSPFQRLLETPTRLFGFEEHAGAAHAEPLALDEGEMPHGSIWPLITVLGVFSTTIGFIFGMWFILVGVGLAAWGMWGWITQIRPRPPEIPIDPDHSTH
jgi:hypothetical protein